MSDFLATWTLTRGRFVDALKDLTSEQLNWRPYPGVLTIAEMALHVAGVEASFALQLKLEEAGQWEKLRLAATEGSVNDNPFPFSAEEMTPEFVASQLEASKEMIEPLLSDPDAWRDRQIKSALGPMIDGTGAFVRLCSHPFYHQGQIHMIRQAPGFPSAA
jgi:uncharacterized damage-inducible protein DinB